MTEPPSDLTEGRAKSVICSVLYKCKKNLKAIEWNYKDLQSSSSTIKFSNQTYQTVSNLTFIGSLEDNGKSLTCTAQFLSGATSSSSTISIKSRYFDKVQHLKVLKTTVSMSVYMQNDGPSLLKTQSRQITKYCSPSRI